MLFLYVLLTGLLSEGVCGGGGQINLVFKGQVDGYE